MTSERIKEIQEQTAYPESLSVKQALLQVWNECEQDHNKKKHINVVSKSAFRFSGIKNKEKFIKYITAPNRETAIAYFEIENPHLTWRTITVLD
ncbi:hypothetical protein Phi13:2_gp002 [Cellulophaga phage phi13:2]|uniref:Uncharacterized protein n=1 Tax=Cellulophaga phage phi13:2 TaxID=1328030 RepID=S0A5G6_9CAUD|nr:hypothetical protein Phi13:2_gp002 [Cellulophaga phage phi13:2]AGO49612.1 hypothetical protein Phi13:2_gp002 [Cellulophaga phage phi13:2]